MAVVAPQLGAQSTRPGVDMGGAGTTSGIDIEATPREHRPLRCGEPRIYQFATEDGVVLRLTRFEGGAKGPVILSPGFGTSSIAYTIDTVETNYPEYLYEHGYDVWVLDYRASPLLPSSATQFTLDDIARFDYPATVQKVRAETGAESVQIMAHCVGSLTMLMSLGLGLEGVRSAVSSQLTLHPRAGALNQLRAGIFAADLIDAVGIDVLTTDIDDDPSWFERLYDKALAFYPEGDEPCDRPFCRRVAFTFGESYDHDQLNQATHEHIDEAFGDANILTLRHVTKIIREDHAVSWDDDHDYLDDVARLRLPISFIHGEHNRLFLPEGSALTYEFLREHNGPDFYTRQIIPGYSHMDCFIGKDAARDVYPVVTAELDRYNGPGR
ncbi:alpha/beta fold hydrolase [Microbacterium pumilum]|uniref:alpha/beta fold hydrolase n=1 Tax=Microbacterium pumilum TaxID=344165 RepID=UPI0031E256DC